MAERSVRFYELTNEVGERLPADLPYADLRDAINAVSDEEAYVPVGSTEVLGSTYLPGSAGARPAVPLITLDRITRDVRLRIERRRNYRPLVLEEDETIAEPSFFSLFPRNVLAVMRNSGSAPGVASFRDYINHLDVLTGKIGITPLADRNAVRAISEVGTLTKLTVAVGAEVSPDDFADTPLIADVVGDARRRLGAVGFEFTISVAARGMSEVSDRVVEEVRQLATTGTIDSVRKAQMAYRRLEDGRADSYDFISEAVTTSTEVELAAEHVQPTSLSAAQAIAEAYDEKYDDIMSALNLSN